MLGCLKTLHGQIRMRSPSDDSYRIGMVWRTFHHVTQDACLPKAATFVRDTQSSTACRGDIVLQAEFLVRIQHLVPLYLSDALHRVKHPGPAHCPPRSHLLILGLHMRPASRGDKSANRRAAGSARFTVCLAL